MSLRHVHRNARSAAVALLVGVGALAVAPVARAQQTAGGAVAQARTLFQAGVGAADAGRWREAVDDFERSYALVHEPVILFDLAGAQARVGALVAARASYQSFVRDATGAQPEQLAAAHQALAELDLAIPRVRIEARALGGEDHIALDGRAIPAREIAGERAIDPGEHELVRSRTCGARVHTRFVLARGEARSVVLGAPGCPGVASSPLFWVATAGALLAVGVVAGLAVCAVNQCATTDAGNGSTPSGAL